jgi:hypothetical protein
MFRAFIHTIVSKQNGFLQMSVTKLFFLVLIFLLLGAFVFFAVTDVSVPQEEISKPVPLDRSEI